MEGRKGERGLSSHCVTGCVGPSCPALARFLLCPASPVFGSRSGCLLWAALAHTAEAWTVPEDLSYTWPHLSSHTTSQEGCDSSWGDAGLPKRRPRNSGKVAKLKISQPVGVRTRTQTPCSQFDTQCFARSWCSQPRQVGSKLCFLMINDPLSITPEQICRHFSIVSHTFWLLTFLKACAS